MAEEDYTAMAKEDYREYHRQLAARLRSAAEHSTTKVIKARLVAEAEQHERIARGETEIRVQSPPISSAPSDEPQEKRKGERRRNGSLFVPFSAG
jgi:predicted RNA polymerase sigma factor